MTEYYTKQDEYESFQILVAEEFADIPSVQTIVSLVHDDEFYALERAFIDVYKHLEAKWK